MKPLAKSLDGKSQQLCQHRGCGRRSLRGLAPGHFRCPYHWVVAHWGASWARRCYPHYAPKPYSFFDFLTGGSR
jgi:hypothetical protein